MYIIDPLTDPRWVPFVDRHSSASAFHTAGWLRALAETYDYQPLAVTSSPPDKELTDALPVCRIESWITGNRLVSLPFTDHCQPLAASDTDTAQLIQFAAQNLRSGKENFLELRPAFPIASALFDGAHQSACYYFHCLDLTPPLPTIFSSLHKDSIQRKIRRADREGLQYEEGCSPDILDRFYGLLLRTRRRHQLPPQPINWFRSLLKNMGDSLQLRIATKDQVPIASILTLRHRNSMIYKYGCSDERYHAMGGMPFLFWRLIEDAKAASIPMVDFGRSDLENPGLIRFKDQWGTLRMELKYYRLPAPAKRQSRPKFAKRAAKGIFARLPDSLLQLVGNVVYRHIG